MAYERAPDLACFRFLDVYLAPNDLHALALLNERVSGCWLGNQGAVLVRRPRVLALDHGGRLHSATGKCIEYRDGWGFYAWHGVRVPDKVILTPERLAREDFLKESNPEIRRVIQERMGDRFVSELGGKVIDTSPRGTLYEVEMPAPAAERVARYVQVQDASTPRQYFLRVPPNHPDGIRGSGLELRPVGRSVSSGARDVRWKVKASATITARIHSLIKGEGCASRSTCVALNGGSRPCFYVKHLTLRRNLEQQSHLLLVLVFSASRRWL